MPEDARAHRPAHADDDAAWLRARFGALPAAHAPARRIGRRVEALRFVRPDPARRLSRRRRIAPPFTDTHRNTDKPTP